MSEIIAEPVTDAQRDPREDYTTAIQALPKSCPSWCYGEHEASLAEGTALEAAKRHVSIDYGNRLPALTVPHDGRTFRKGGGGWRVQLEAAGSCVGWHGATYVQLFTDSRRDERVEVRLDLTPAEALELASTLTRQAEVAMFAEHRPRTS